MRLRWLGIALIGIALFAADSWSESSILQNDAASTAAAGTPSDDAEFAAFQPMTRDMRPPKAVSAPDPKFPDLPEGAEQRGIVVMLIGINAKGHVQAVRVLRSDESAFDKTAVDTVKKWKFKPAMKAGRAVPVQVTVEMKFER